MAVTLPDDRWP